MQPLRSQAWRQTSSRLGINNLAAGEYTTSKGTAVRQMARCKVQSRQGLAAEILKNMVCRREGSRSSSKGAAGLAGCAQPMKRLLRSAVGGLPYVALCASVLALGLIAGFLLAAPLTSQASRASMLSGCVHP